MEHLNYSNQWEADVYTYKGKKITALKQVEIKGKTYNVVTRKLSIPYDDMGHTYYGTSNHYFITEEVFGIVMEFDLNKIVERVDVIPIDYNAEKKT